MKRRTRRYAKRQLTWLRKLPGGTLIDVTGRDARERRAPPSCTRMIAAPMRFEKWQALGNDYLIVEADELPVPAHPDAVRRLCDRHIGPGADGVLELAPPDEPGFVARLRIFNPDGSEAELSGNGAREAILYLRRRGWTDARQFSIETRPGRSARRSPARRRAASTWAARTLPSKDFPAGRRTARGEVGGCRFQHVSIGNPQCAIRVADRASSRRSTCRDRPGDRARSAVPQPHERLVLARARPGRDPRPDLRARRGGDAVVRHRRVRRRRRVRRCAAATRRSPSRLDGGELEVDVDESLHVDLNGWAVPVFKGEVS